MKILTRFLALLAGMFAAPVAHAQISPNELVAPKIEISGGNLNFTVQPSVSGRNYQLQCSDTMAGGTWTDVGVVRSGDGGNLVISTPYVPGVQKRFYRVALVEAPAAPEGFSLISAGSFQMGNMLSVSGDGFPDELPVHTVQVSAFYMAKHEVTKALWDEVRAWGLNNGYTDLPAGNGSYASKGVNHPVHTISWYAMVKWCNARSEKEGLVACYYTNAAQTVAYRTGNTDIDNTMAKWAANGYRLPTDAEWEMASRGGLGGKRFPWGDTITHSQANYYSDSYFIYDVSPTRGFHPLWSNNNDGKYPYTSPVGSFAANGYGLYDMAGNVFEWCWDWYDSYSAASQTDPHGATSGSYRVDRGGSWALGANYCRTAYRRDGGGVLPFQEKEIIGFRLARSADP
jgi:formylglycine-generating enzyme required for sulfatase activity